MLFTVKPRMLALDTRPALPPVVRWLALCVGVSLCWFGDRTVCGSGGCSQAYVLHIGDYLTTFGLSGIHYVDGQRWRTYGVSPSTEVVSLPEALPVNVRLEM